jgi:hypothetical protein
MCFPTVRHVTTISPGLFLPAVRPPRILIVALGLAVCCASPSVVKAQARYVQRGWVVAAGVGTAAGERYRLDCTVGQPIVGTSKTAILPMRSETVGFQIWHLARWLGPPIEIPPEVSPKSEDRPVLSSFDGVQPSPAGSAVSIRYTIASDASVSGQPNVVLRIYDITGRCVARLTRGLENCGQHVLTWNAVTDAGVPVTAGVYFARLQMGNRVFTRRIVIAR